MYTLLPSACRDDRSLGQGRGGRPAPGSPPYMHKDTYRKRLSERLIQTHADTRYLHSFRHAYIDTPMTHTDAYDSHTQRHSHSWRHTDSQTQIYRFTQTLSQTWGDGANPIAAHWFLLNPHPNSLDVSKDRPMLGNWKKSSLEFPRP